LEVSVESRDDEQDNGEIIDDDDMGDTNEFNIKSDTISPKLNTLRSTSQELM
jgi:hypothetical protein